ncbi:MAG TPA: hypothetical protein VHR16_00705 [Candidatus Limnocylindrales bacterium]|nr:hypothetical protein [Candidatus Limnocylindrales bacterium]
MKRGQAMQALVRGLMSPILALLAIGATHLAAELLRPELQTVITPPVVMPIYLVVGGWAGWSTVRAGGSLARGVLAGLLLGVLPVALQLIGFGVIAGRDGATVLTSGVFGFLALLWGAILGAGIARDEPAAVVTQARR